MGLGDLRAGEAGKSLALTASAEAQASAFSVADGGFGRGADPKGRGRQIVHGIEEADSRFVDQTEKRIVAELSAVIEMADRKTK